MASYFGDSSREVTCSVHLIGSLALPGSSLSTRISFLAGSRGSNMELVDMVQEYWEMIKADAQT